MRVLHIINDLSSGGAEKILEVMLPLINDRTNIEVEVLLLSDKNNVYYNSMIQKKIKVSVLKFNSMYNFRNIFEIKKFIIKGKFTIIHSHLFPTQYWVALSKMMMLSKKIKFVTTEHSTKNRRRKLKYFRIIDKIIYSQYNKIISVSEETMKNLVDWIDNKKKNISKHIVIENGIDINKIKNTSPYKKSDLIKDLKNEIKLICMVGRFSAAKDQITIIKAIHKLSPEFQLLLIGEGPEEITCKKIVEILSLKNRVHFLGFRSDVYKILKTVDLVVLSSNWEAFGLAAVEGMASGKPVIVSDVKGLSSVIDDPELRFERGNYVELASLINTIMSNAEVYENKIRYSILRSQKFDINFKLEEIVKLYRELDE